MSLKTIAVSEENKKLLSKLGHAGMSYNDVLSEILNKRVPQNPQIVKETA